MLKGYFEKNKHQLLPHIKDWTLDYNEWRLETNVNKLDYWTWFYFHPSAHKLFTYGYAAINVVIFALIAAYLLYKGYSFVSVFPLLIMLYFIFNIMDKIKNRTITKNTTLYDLYMREY